MEPERCVFGVFFPHTGQHQPHDLVMTQGSMAASCGGLPKPCTAAHRTGCAEDQRPDGGKTGRPVPRLWAAMPMKPRPEIIWRLSDSNMVILRLYDWSKIVLLTDSFVFRKKLLCDPCKNYQPPHRIFVHRWEKLCVRYPTSAKAQIRHERRTTQCPVRTTTS